MPSRTAVLGVKFERQALQEPNRMAVMLALFGVAAVCVRLGTMHWRGGKRRNRLRRRRLRRCWNWDCTGME